MDWSTILASSKEVVAALITFITQSVSVLIGIVMIGSGFQKMLEFSRGHRQGQSTAGPVLINVLIGSIMIQISFMIDKWVETLFGGKRQDPNVEMAYMPPAVAGNEMFNQMVQAGVLWVSAIGFVAIVRGLILWNDLSNGRNAQQGAGWKGLWHVVAGGMAVNIPGVIALFK